MIRSVGLHLPPALYSSVRPSPIARPRHWFAEVETLSEAPALAEGTPAGGAAGGVEAAAAERGAGAPEGAHSGPGVPPGKQEVEGEVKVGQHWGPIWPY